MRRKHSFTVFAPGFVLIVALILALGGTSCKGKHDRVIVENEEPAASSRPVSVVLMNDAKASAQLIGGFYPVENGAWRWTAGKFSILLGMPPTAAQSGATLTLALTIPDAVIAKLKDITLTASARGTKLQSTRYDKPGSYTYTADVPSSLLTGDSVRVDFALDKSMAPDVDKRELGVVVSSIGLSSK